jgi:hypothetical protein
MKKLLLGIGLALAVGPLAFASVPTLFISSGATTHTETGAAGTVVYTNGNFNGWEIDLAFGDSKSPGLDPFGLQLQATTIECKSRTTGAHSVPVECADLRIWLSDTDFAQQPGFIVGYSLTSVSGSIGPTTMKSWVGPGNTLFESDGSDGRPSGGTALPTITLTATGGHNDTLPVSVSPPYALTIETLFTGSCAGVNCASYGSTATISAIPVPEPASVALFGTVLGLCATRLLRRRKRA